MSSSSQSRTKTLTAKEAHEELKRIDFNQLVKNPAKYAELLAIKDLEQLIGVLRDYYYNADEDDDPLVPDFVYDEIEDVLRGRCPNSQVLNKTDAPSRGPTVKLPYYMHSQKKAKADSGDMNRWLAKYHGPYMVSHKIDGISIMLTYDRSSKGVKVHLYTRGHEGYEGHDVTRHAKYLDLGKYDFTKGGKGTDGGKGNDGADQVAVRGELIVPIDTWEKYYSQHPNVRNWVAGKINDKRSSAEDLKRIKFVTYEVLEPSGLSPSQQFDLLEAWGLHTVPHVLKNKLDEPELKKLLQQAEDKGPYQVDGLIVTQDEPYVLPTGSDRPKYSIAFKMQLEGDEAQTMVEKVIWNPSKDMLLKPVVVMKPVTLSGATLSRATAHNAKYVVDNKIGHGAIITVIRSGKVIPYIKSIDVAAPKTDLPDVNYVWDKDGLNFRLVDKSTDVYHRQLVHMTKHLGIDHLGEGVLQKLVDLGYMSPAEVLNITLEELHDVPSLGKNADKIHESLNKLRTKGVKLAVLMDASNVFPAGVGTRIMQSVLDEIPDLLDHPVNGALKDELVAIKGIQVKTAEKIMEGLPAFKDFLAEIPDIRVVDLKRGGVSGNRSESDSGEYREVFKDMRVIFTGVRDKEIEEIIENSGGTVASSVSKAAKKQVVVAKDPTADSNKLKSARDLGVDIMSLSDFRKKYDV